MTAEVRKPWGKVWTALVYRRGYRCLVADGSLVTLCGRSGVMIPEDGDVTCPDCVALVLTGPMRRSRW